MRHLLLVRIEITRTIFAIVAQLKLHVFQLDVKLAFLHGKLDEEIYIEQP